MEYIIKENREHEEMDSEIELKIENNKLEAEFAMYEEMDTDNIPNKAN